MPMALGMLFVEQQILANLFITEDSRPAVIGPIAAPAPKGVGRSVQSADSNQQSPGGRP
jgi:hypothetical protein